MTSSGPRMRKSTAHPNTRASGAGRRVTAIYRSVPSASTAYRDAAERSSQSGSFQPRQKESRVRSFPFGSRRLVETSGAPHWRPTAISLVLAASSLAVVISPAAAAYPGASNGLLAFGMKDSAGNGQIYTSQPDGTGTTPLTTGAHTHLCAAYSADASKIAYCSDESDTFEIWTMNADGTDQAQLTKLGGFATFPDYSPDGSTVAFGGT